MSVLFLSCSLSSNVGPPLVVSHDTKYEINYQSFIDDSQMKKNFIDKIFFRSTYLQLPIFNHCSSMITNIVSTNILEVFAILCWFSTWTLTDVIMEMMTSNIIINVAISLTVGTISGLLAYILQIPLFYNLK